MGLREWLIPEEKKYFEFFEKEAAVVKRGAQTLVKITKDYKNLKKYVRKMDNLEHESDCIVHDIYNELNRTFITPIDREDICELATRLDDIIDMVDAATRRLMIYNLKGECPRYLPQFASLILKGSKYVEKAIEGLKDHKTFGDVEKYCIKINDVENDGDALLSESLGALFDSDDVKLIVKLKDIYELMEVATDKCEEVANILQGIVIKEG